MTEELERIKKLADSAWYYPGSKPNIEGTATKDIQYLLDVINFLQDQICILQDEKNFEFGYLK